MIEHFACRFPSKHVKTVEVLVYVLNARGKVLFLNGCQKRVQKKQGLMQKMQPLGTQQGTLFLSLPVVIVVSNHMLSIIMLNTL